MRKWLLRVAVPPAAFLLGWGAARLCEVVPKQSPSSPSAQIDLQPFLTPPLRHGGCQGPLWLPSHPGPSQLPVEAPLWTPKP